MESIHLIWLYSDIDDTDENCRNIISQFDSIINKINIFKDRDECVDFLTNIDNENICLIISGVFCQDMIPLIHDLSQISHIFIYYENEIEYEQWIKDWLKIRGIFKEISSIYDSLKAITRQYEQNAISFSLVDLFQTNLDQLDPMFMYSQILKEILLDMKFEQKHFIGFIEYCHETFKGNEGRLKNVNEFEGNYRDKTPIWWYTYNYFLYSMLNQSLRLTDLDNIIQIGFYIQDLYRQIKRLHQQ